MLGAAKAANSGHDEVSAVGWDMRDAESESEGLGSVVPGDASSCSRKQFA